MLLLTISQAEGLPPTVLTVIANILIQATIHRKIIDYVIDIPLGSRCNSTHILNRTTQLHT